jgi:hypothetical protein
MGATRDERTTRQAVAEAEEGSWPVGAGLSAVEARAGDMTLQLRRRSGDLRPQDVLVLRPWLVWSRFRSWSRGPGADAENAAAVPGHHAAGDRGSDHPRPNRQRTDGHRGVRGEDPAAV